MKAPPRGGDYLKKRVELHSMLLTISPFMFWDDSKTFSESILSLLVLTKK